MTRRKRLTKRKKNNRLKRKTFRIKIYGGSFNLSIFNDRLDINIVRLINDAVLINDNCDAMKDFYSELNEEERNALFDVYQEKSNNINGFLRDGFDFFTNERVDEVDESEIEIAQEYFLETIQMESEMKVETIKELDNIFVKKAPTLEKTTILFRGTEDLYNEDVVQGYISTTKTIDTIFDMVNRGDDFLSSNKPCCINMLIVDAGIPYLDLQLTDNYWCYQKEVLLPRGLKSSLLGETSYTYKHIHYNVYIFHIILDETTKYSIKKNDYKKLDIENKDLFVDNEVALFLFKEQANEIDNLMNYFDEKKKEHYDELNQKVYVLSNELLRYNLTRNIRFLCTKKKYMEICEDFMKYLEEIIDYAITNSAIKKGYESKINKIIENKRKIHDLLLQNNYINQDNYLKI